MSASVPEHKALNNLNDSGMDAKTRATALLTAIEEKSDFSICKDTIGFLSELLSKHTPQQISFSFNGGKDCTVLLHLLNAVVVTQYGGWDNVTVIYFPLENEFAEVKEFIATCEALYGFKVQEVTGGFKNGLTTLLAEKPLITHFLMGQRKGDPGVVGLDIMAPSSDGWPAFTRVNPLLHWTYTDIWRLLRENELPYCKLYDQGYTSLGPETKTKKNPLLLNADSGEHLPAYMLSIEDAHSERDSRKVT